MQIRQALGEALRLQFNRSNADLEVAKDLQDNAGAIIKLVRQLYAPNEPGYHLIAKHQASVADTFFAVANRDNPCNPALVKIALSAAQIALSESEYYMDSRPEIKKCWNQTYNKACELRNKARIKKKSKWQFKWPLHRSTKRV